MYTHSYKVFGLTIRSEIMFNELISIGLMASAEYDVHISYGIVPRKIVDAKVVSRYLEASANEMYFFIEGIAHFYIGNGDSIIVEPITDQLERLKVYLLGGCLGTLLTQRRIIGIHGGAITVSGKGVIVTGRAGSGKSTLTSAFIREGYQFLSDDICALGKDGKGNIAVYPSYPQQKLCTDALKIMDFDTSKLKLIDPIRSKYAIPTVNNFLNTEAMLSHVFEVTPVERKEVAVEKVYGIEKLRILMKNIYGIELIIQTSLEADFIKSCLGVAQKVQVYKLSRPISGFTVREQINAICEALSEDNVFLEGKKSNEA